MDIYGSVSRALVSSDLAPTRWTTPSAGTDETAGPGDAEGPDAAGGAPGASPGGRSPYAAAKSLAVSREYENSLREIVGGTDEKAGRDDTVTLPLRDLNVTLRGMEHMQLEYTECPQAEHEEKRKDFNSQWKKAFLKDLGTDPAKEQALRKAGLNDTDFAMMQDGKCPPGYQVHHKVPLDDGGQNEFSNFVLIENEPAHKALTNLHMKSIRGLEDGDTRTIDWWTPKGFVYPPDPSYISTEPRG